MAGQWQYNRGCVSVVIHKFESKYINVLAPAVVTLTSLSKYTSVLAPAVVALTSLSLTGVDTVGCLFALLMMGILVSKEKVVSVTSFRVMFCSLMHLCVMRQPS
jgi:hypothetical protein